MRKSKETISLLAAISSRNPTDESRCLKALLDFLRDNLRAGLIFVEIE